MNATQGLKLFRPEASWRLTKKFWSPTYFIYNLHKNRILYITLHARKVTIEERKQFKTTQVKYLVIKLALFSGGSVVLGWSEVDGCLHSNFK